MRLPCASRAPGSWRCTPIMASSCCMKASTGLRPVWAMRWPTCLTPALAPPSMAMRSICRPCCALSAFMRFCTFFCASSAAVCFSMLAVVAAMLARSCRSSAAKLSVLIPASLSFALRLRRFCCWTLNFAPSLSAACLAASMASEVLVVSFSANASAVARKCWRALLSLLSVSPSVCCKR